MQSEVHAAKETSTIFNAFKKKIKKWGKVGENAQSSSLLGSLGEKDLEINLSAHHGK